MSAQKKKIKQRRSTGSNRRRLLSRNDRFLAGRSSAVHSVEHHNLDAYQRPCDPRLRHGCPTGCELHGRPADICVSRPRITVESRRESQLFLHNPSIAVRVTQLTNFSRKASDDVAYPCQGRSAYRIISKRTALSADCGQVPSPSELSSVPVSPAFFWTTSVSEMAPCLSCYSTCWWYVWSVSRTICMLSINEINFSLNPNPSHENSNLYGAWNGWS